MNILLLTHRLPYAPNRGDRLRAYHLMRFLRRYARLRLVSLVHDREEASHARDMKELAEATECAPAPKLRNMAAGAARLFTDTPLTHSLLDSPRIDSAIRAVLEGWQPDVVIAYCSGMAKFALRAPLADVPCVLDMVDVDSEKWRALGEAGRWPLTLVYRREAACLSRFEARAAAHACATTVVNEREAESLRALAPRARVEVMPNGIDVRHFRPEHPAAQSRSVVFCGVMNYEPNAAAAEWLVKDVWPLVRARCRDARLLLVGAHPQGRVRSLADSRAGVEVTGSVPDVRPYLWQAAVSVAPLATARGIQNKVLEAIAAGLPVIVTPNVASGLPREIMGACTTAANAATFADSIVAHLMLAPERRRSRADEASLDTLTWERQLQRWLPLLDQAAAGPTPAIRRVV